MLPVKVVTEPPSAWRQLRLFLCAVSLLVFQWTLLVRPREVLAIVPILWPLPSNHTPPALFRPRDVLDAFDLGIQAARYESLGCSDNHEPSVHRDEAVPLDNSSHRRRKCAAVLVRAGAAVGAPGPLTAVQMARAREVVESVRAERSVGDRILGFFSLVNILLVFAVGGILATVLPCMYHLFGECLRAAATALYERIVRPAHELGCFELLAYLVAACLSAQAARYPPALAASATLTALLAGGLLLPCWLYSTALHASRGGDQTAYAMVTCALLSLNLAPLAIAHESQLVGFFAVAGLFGTLGFFFAVFPLVVRARPVTRVSAQRYATLQRLPPAFPSHALEVNCHSSCLCTVRARVCA
jgi:hypothetical protein